MVSRRRFIISVAGAAASAALGTYFLGDMLSPPRIDPVNGFTGVTGDKPPKRPAREVFLLTEPKPPVFQPMGVLCLAGDSVMFIATNPGHTVTPYHPSFGRTKRVPDGVPAFSSPVLPQGAYWLYTFEQEGIYDIYSASYEAEGMAMRVVVPPSGRLEVPPSNSPSTESELRPPDFLAGLVLEDPALEPRNIIIKDTVP